MADLVGSLVRSRLDCVVEFDKRDSDIGALFVDKEALDEFGIAIRLSELVDSVLGFVAVFDSIAVLELMEDRGTVDSVERLKVERIFIFVS